jgi:hypothetical protein
MQLESEILSFDIVLSLRKDSPTKPLRRERGRKFGKLGEGGLIGDGDGDGDSGGF